MLLGVVSTYLVWYDPDAYATLLSGKQSNHTNDYFYWFIFSYIIMFVVVGGYLIQEPPTFIDKVTTITYLFFHGLSALNYVYYGWPEPKMYIVVAFFSSVIIYICLNIYQIQNGRLHGR